MPKQPAKKKPMGRPPAEIDKRQFEGLCALQCTMEEVCNQFDVSDKTLEKWCKKTYNQSFSVVFKQKRGKGFTSLRRNMYSLSKTNAAMCIFLAKNWLKMKDVPDDPSGESTAAPVKVVIEVKDASSRDNSNGE